MADLKISQLSAATALAGTEVVPVVQSGATKKATIDQILSPAAGKGIDFSANGGDVLTHYEEGSWTPTVAPTSGSYTTVSVAQGSYTRVGRQVTVRFNFTVSDKGTGSGGFVISGLPFTANGSSYAGSGFNASNAASTVLYGVSMTTQFEGYKYDGTDAVVVNQSQVGVITYFV